MGGITATGTDEDEGLVVEVDDEADDDDNDDDEVAEI
jgi:hypothetical protein